MRAVSDPYAGARATMIRRRLLGILVAGLTGCARRDWIDSTLVTVDVSGVWTTQSGSVPLELRLHQPGAVVTGKLVSGQTASGDIVGEVTGDVLRLRTTDGRYRFDLVVAGDDMAGTGRVAPSSGTAGMNRAALVFRRTQ